MFRTIVTMTAIIFMLAHPVFASDKMDHSKMKKMDHGKMDHGSMKMDGGMIMLGSLVVEGVKARAHLKDVSKAMAEMKMEQTHHLMVNFVNEKGGVVSGNGIVAVKVKNPDESEGNPVKLMSMGDGFGADLTLKEKGLYHFYLGTKLEDGVKRQYHFHTEIK